jgi:hypothetical protein
MTGKIIIKDNEYLVRYSNSYGIDRLIPVIEPNVDLVEGELVDFEIVDEFSHPQLFREVGLFEGVPSAMITKRYGND